MRSLRAVLYLQLWLGNEHDMLPWARNRITSEARREQLVAFVLGFVSRPSLVPSQLRLGGPQIPVVVARRRLCRQRLELGGIKDSAGAETCGKESCRGRRGMRGGMPDRR